MYRTEVEAMVDMTREERIAECAKREKIVERILQFVAKENRALTPREEDTVRWERNVIGSIKLGLERETE